jgi:uncharacterized protein
MEIIDLLRGQAGYIKARFALKRIGLFGSYARGEQKASSDIDILDDVLKNELLYLRSNILRLLSKLI